MDTEEAQLLQELEDLDARLCEKESTLKGIAAREAALQDEFAASRDEARQLRLQVAALEFVQTATEDDGPGTSGTASEIEGQRLSPDEPVIPAFDDEHVVAPVVDDERVRARIAMGLNG